MRKVELMRHMDHQAAEAAAEIDVLPGVIRWSRNTTR